MLHEAGRLELTPEQERHRAALLAALEPADGLQAEDLDSIDVASLRDTVHELLRTLREPALALMRSRRDAASGGEGR